MVEFVNFLDISYILIELPSDTHKIRRNTCVSESDHHLVLVALNVFLAKKEDYRWCADCAIDDVEHDTILIYRQGGDNIKTEGDCSSASEDKG